MENYITNKSHPDGSLRTSQLEENESFDFVYQGQHSPYSVWLVKDKVTGRRLGRIGQKAEGYYFLYTPEVSWMNTNDYTLQHGFRTSSPHYTTREEAARDLFAEKV